MRIRSKPAPPARYVGIASTVAVATTTIVLLSLILVGLLAYCLRHGSFDSDRAIGQLIELYIRDCRSGSAPPPPAVDNGGNTVGLDPGEKYEAAILSYGPSAFPNVLWREKILMEAEERRLTSSTASPERTCIGNLLFRMINAWPSEAVAFLCDALGSKDPNVRCISASYLAAVRHPFVDEAIPLLQLATQDADWNVRMVATYSLNEIAGSP